MATRRWFGGVAATVALLGGYVLAGAAPAAAASASASPERTVATNQNPNYSVDVAFDGTNYLVVWTRSVVNFADVLGARVRPDGTVLDTTPIPISSRSSEESNPAVAFDGTQYLVVWQDWRAGNADIYGARVSTAGTVLDTAGLPFSTTAREQLTPAVAFSGAMGLVVWTDLRSGTTWDVYGTRWTSRGGVFDPTGMPVSTAAGHQYAPAVSAAGEHFLSVWTDERSGTGTDVYGARVDVGGSTLDTAGVPFSAGTGDQGFPDVAYDGTNALVAWQDRRSGTTQDVYGTRWSPTSGVLEASGIPISTAAGDQYGVDVAANGPFLVVWKDKRAGPSADLWGTRVTGAGAVSDPGGFTLGATPGHEQFLGVTPGTGTTWAAGYSRTDGGVYLRTVSPK